MTLRNFLMRFNWLSFVATLALSVIGLCVLASAGEARGGVFAGMWKQTAVSLVVGYVLYFAIACVDYRKLLDRLAYPLYLASIAALVLVLVVGAVRFGGRRWLWFFQPSEISKLMVIACLAQLFGEEGLRFKRQYGFTGFLVGCAIVAVPCGLILLEPDLGTALTLVPATMVILIVAGVWRKGLVSLLAAGAILAVTILGAVCEAERPGVSPERRERVLAFVPLKEHQVSRVKTFLFPETDRLAAGYNLHQAKMTIGSGGAAGKGWRNGDAVRRRLLPPMGVMNDFIFCVWAEEMGYAKGSLALLALFALLCVSVAWTGVVAADGRGRLLAFGVAMLVFAHVYVNIGMSVGLVPITGLPLPFLSSGRTFLITVMCALGLIQSVSIHREETT